MLPRCIVLHWFVYCVRCALFVCRSRAQLCNRDLAFFFNYPQEWLLYSSSTLFSQVVSSSSSSASSFSSSSSSSHPIFSLSFSSSSSSSVLASTLQVECHNSLDGAANVSAAPYSRPSVLTDSDAFDRLENAMDSLDGSNVRAVNACVRLFATIYADQTAHHKEQLLSHFVAIIQKAKQRSVDANSN